MHSFVLAASVKDVPIVQAGKAIGLGAGHRPRLARRRHRHRQHLRLDDPVGCPPARAQGRAAGHPVARLRADRGGRLLRPHRRPPRLRPRLKEHDAARRERTDPGHPGADDLDDRLLRPDACSSSSGTRSARSRRRSTTRRERVQQTIEEADRAREEARALLEEHRALIGQAKTEAEEILTEATARLRLAARAGPRGDRGGSPAAPRGDASARSSRRPRRRSVRSATRSAS